MIRARLLKAWPDLSHLFGITPLNFDQLTIPELQVYLTAVEKVAAASRSTKE